jgi:hypothetical protein
MLPRRRLTDVMTHANDCWSPRYPDEDELVRAVDASAALRQLLAAASAPPSTAELRGRSRAIADFRAAQRHSASAPEPGTESTSHARSGKHAVVGLRRLGRWSARLTVACTALVVLLGGTAATAVAGELPTALRKAVSNLVTHRRRLPPLAELISDLRARTAAYLPSRTAAYLPGPSAAPRLSPSWGRPTA